MASPQTLQERALDQACQTVLFVALELSEGIQIKNLNTWCIKKKGWMRPFA